MRQATRIGLSTAAAAMIGIAFAALPWGAALEEAVGLDWLFRLRGPVPAPSDVAVVAFDRSTARELELSPDSRDWSRVWHARIIDQLTARGASVIALDIAFDTPREEDEDAALTAAVAQSGRVVLFERLAAERRAITDPTGKLKGFVWSEQLVPPIDRLLKGAIGCAPFPLPKVGPTVRRFWAFKPGPDVATLPAVALQVHALDLLGSWRNLLRAAGAGGVDELPRSRQEITNAAALRRMMRHLRATFQSDPGLADRVVQHLNDASIPALTALAGEQRRRLTALARLYQGGDDRYVNFYGPPGTIATVPYHTLLQGQQVRPEMPRGGPPRPDLAGKVVFVGSSDLHDPGQPDRFSTVFSRADGVDLSGVEIAATAYANLSSTSSIRQAGPLTAGGVLLGFGAVVGFAAAALGAPFAVPAVVALTASFVAAVYLAFAGAHLWLPLTTPLFVQVPVALVVGLLGQYVVARRERQRARRMASYFIPEQVVREVTEKGLHPLSIGREVYATCLATDVESFTAVTEALRPQELAHLMNEYFETLAAALQKNGADICEFYADSIMAAWTSHGPDPDLYRHACLAALDARAAINQFNARNGAKALPTRIGLHAGRVLMGPAGGGGRFVYGVRGDAANVAARIEQLNKHLQTRILASWDVCGGETDLILRPVGNFKLMGKSSALSLAEIVGRAGEVDPGKQRLLQRFDDALAVFRRQRWTEAALLFKAILDDDPHDGPSRFYLSRCRLYEMTAPAQEDAAVISMLTK